MTRIPSVYVLSQESIFQNDMTSEAEDVIE